MNKNLLIVIIGAVIILGLIIYFGFNNFEGFSKDDDSENLNEQQSQATEQKPKSDSVRYFSQSDNIVITVEDNTLYTDNPTTTVTYYALDKSGNNVHFKSSDNAYVRVLGVTEWYQDNVEIFHPKKTDGTVDNTMYSGGITIDGTGKYLVKVCLGPSINLNSEGTMIWPFGCYEDTTSQVIDVYSK